MFSHCLPVAAVTHQSRMSRYLRTKCWHQLGTGGDENCRTGKRETGKWRIEFIYLFI